MTQKRHLKSKLRLFVFILLLGGLFTGGFVAANDFLGPRLSNDPPQEEVDLAELDGMNVLMMGVDERDNDGSLLTDTMILANINTQDNRISMLSIPRDTKVELPGHGVDKINAANVYGGPEMAMDVVSDLTGMPVDYYVITSFNGFKGIVDALGGVTVDVEKEMHYHERAHGGAYNIDLLKGVQQLNGDQALMYARFRHDQLGDITRTQRQLKLLTAIGEEVMKPGTIPKLPRLITEINKNMETNMGLSQMATMAKAAKNINNVQIVTQTMPGWFLNENGISYWYVDPENAKQVAFALFEEGKVVDMVQGEINQDPSNTQVAVKNYGQSAQTDGNQDSTGEENADTSFQGTDEPAPDQESTSSGNGEGANSGEAGEDPGINAGENSSANQGENPVEYPPGAAYPQPPAPPDNGSERETDTP